MVGAHDGVVWLSVPGCWIIIGEWLAVFAAAVGWG